jgi:hypothetical protein
VCKKGGPSAFCQRFVISDNNKEYLTGSYSLEICVPENRRSYKQQSNQQPEVKHMFRILAAFALIWAFLQVAPLATAATDEQQNSAQPVNAVIEWNRTLLAIVRTPGAQPATIHSTRNFAILHAAIYDAVNNIDPKFRPYLVRLPDVPRSASKIAAADEAAHDVLVFLYPAFQVSLDTELQQDLAQIPDNERKAQGVSRGASSCQPAARCTQRGWSQCNSTAVHPR